MINEISCKNDFSRIGQWDTVMLAWCKACTLKAGEKKERITKIWTLPKPTQKPETVYSKWRNPLGLYCLRGEKKVWLIIHLKQ